MRSPDMSLPKYNMTEEELRRLSWRCRRGLLELDIVLHNFSQKHLPHLSADELIAFDALLDLPDPSFLELVTLKVGVADVNFLAVKKSKASAMQAVIAKLSHY